LVHVDCFFTPVHPHIVKLSHYHNGTELLPDIKKAGIYPAFFVY
jgi:hypothetical protein